MHQYTQKNMSSQQVSTDSSPSDCETVPSGGRITEDCSYNNYWAIIIL